MPYNGSGIADGWVFNERSAGQLKYKLITKVQNLFSWSKEFRPPELKLITNCSPLLQRPAQLLAIRMLYAVAHTNCPYEQCRIIKKLLLINGVLRL